MKTAFHKAAAVTVVTLAVALSAGCAKDQGAAHPSNPPAPESSAPSSTAASPATSEGPATNTPTPTDETSTPAPTSATPTPTPTPTQAAAILKKGDSGDKVRELNHRLLQLDWYAGKIQPTYDAATVEGVTGFQRKRGFPATGEVDQQTWDKLVAMTKTPSHDQMYNILRAGPALYKQGSTGDAVRRIQVRLKELAWYEEKTITGTYGPVTVAAVKGFQEKRGIPVTGEIDQRTLDLLVGMTKTPTTEEMYNKPPKQTTGAAKLDARCMTGRAMCIDKNTRKLAWVVDGQVKLTLDVRFGSELTPTREGAFSVGWKSRDHVSTIYHTPMPYAMFFSGGQAVHYSSDFAARGYNGASHGCVNVRDKQSIIWLFDQVHVGDKVIVYRS
ncbi:L,D-transpeptidase family protein [Aestuariimicrobium soli]|uniref:L,D-transpeptidase family protein n=1 Tax=Aestuariimicrobium soli TaxID=2035834 RepID=UPI003EB9FAD9